MAYGNTNGPGKSGGGSPAGDLSDVWKQLGRSSGDLSDETDRATDAMRSLWAELAAGPDKLKESTGKLAGAIETTADLLRKLGEAVTGAVGQLAGGGVKKAAPFVDLTGNGPGDVETLTPDGAKPKAKKDTDPDKGSQAGEAAGRLQAVANGMQSIASMGGQPAALVMAVGGQIAKVAEQFGAAGKVVGQFVQVVTGLPQLFKSASDSVNQYVQAFSPMLAGRYDRAWKDLTAAIGEQLTPVLKAVTDVVRWFADGIAGLTPVIKPIVSAVLNGLQPVVSLVGEIFRELVTEFALVAQAFAPLVQLVAQLAAGPLMLMVQGLRAVVQVVAQVTKAVAGMLGLKTPEYDGSSFRKSAQQASFTSSEDLWKKMVEATANQGRAAKVDPVPNLLEAIKQRLDAMPQEFAAAVGDKISGAAKAYGDAVGTVFQKFAEGKGLGPVANTLADMARGVSLKRN